MKQETNEKNTNVVSSPKIPYESPRLREIELVADEVLAIGCKLTGGGFAVGISPCTLSSCSGEGS